MVVVRVGLSGKPEEEEEADATEERQQRRSDDGSENHPGCGVVAGEVFLAGFEQCGMGDG
jgi:hypothetical protein